MAALGENMKTLKYTMKQEIKSYQKKHMKAIIRCIGNERLVKGRRWVDVPCLNAVLGGHTNALKWLLDDGCCRHTEIDTNAVLSGHIETED